MKISNVMKLLSLASLLLVTGCGSMIVETNRPDADIYVDGRHVGIGRATVPAMGTPKTVIVRAEDGDEVVVQEVRRTFTVKTLLLMPFSYFTSALWAWEYPDRAFLHFEKKAVAKAESGWDQAGADLWGQPMYPKESTSTPESATPTALDNDPWKAPLRKPKHTPPVDQG